MSWWAIAAIGNAVIFVAYLAISFAILRGVVRSGQLLANPLAAATSAIFFTCAVHHGAHALMMGLPGAGIHDHDGSLMRLVFDHWYLALWDVLGAAVAVWYWTLRGRFPALVRGAAIFEDLRERQRQALDINDNVVQGLATAKLALDIGDQEEAARAVDSTLAAARTIITELLGPHGTGVELGPGHLRRKGAATRER